MNTTALAPDAVATYAASPREGRRSGATLTIVNDASGGRVTVRFRRPKDFTAVLVDVMTGSDNESNFDFLGTLRGTNVFVSPRSKCDAAKGARAKTILEWALRAAASGDLRTVRCLHEGVCGRCGRKLTVPASLDRGLGPECATL
jgi:hypothetical protein